MRGALTRRALDLLAKLAGRRAGEVPGVLEGIRPGAQGRPARGLRQSRAPAAAAALRQHRQRGDDENRQPGRLRRPHAARPGAHLLRDRRQPGRGAAAARTWSCCARRASKCCCWATASTRGSWAACTEFEGKRFKDVSARRPGAGHAGRCGRRRQRAEAALKESKALLQALQGRAGRAGARSAPQRAADRSPACLVRGEGEPTCRRSCGACWRPVARKLPGRRAAAGAERGASAGEVPGWPAGWRGTSTSWRAAVRPGAARGRPAAAARGVQPAPESTARAADTVQSRARVRPPTPDAGRNCRARGIARGAARGARWRQWHAPSRSSAIRTRCMAAPCTTRSCTRWRARCRNRACRRCASTIAAWAPAPAATTMVVARPTMRSRSSPGGAQRWPAAALVLAGFSFGGVRGAAGRAGREPCARLITVAPASTRCRWTGLRRAGLPWLLVQGEADEVVDRGTCACLGGALRAAAAAASWLPGVGHFFHGRAARR